MITVQDFFIMSDKSPTTKVVAESLGTGNAFATVLILVLLGNTGIQGFDAFIGQSDPAQISFDQVIADVRNLKESNEELSSNLIEAINTNSRDISQLVSAIEIVRRDIADLMELINFVDIRTANNQEINLIKNRIQEIEVHMEDIALERARVADSGELTNRLADIYESQLEIYQHQINAYQEQIAERELEIESVHRQ